MVSGVDFNDEKVLPTKTVTSDVIEGESKDVPF